MRQDIVKAAMAGRDPGPIIRKAMDAQIPNIVDASALAYLTGVKRTIDQARPHLKAAHSLALVYRDEAAALARDLEIPAKNLAAVKKQFGKNAKKTLTLSGDALSERIGKELDKASAAGLTRREATRAIRDGVADAGLGPTKDYQLEAIYRTQTQAALNAGSWDASHSPAIDDILWGYTYVTIGDSRVRASHAEQDGISKPKDDPYWEIWWPPNGWNCRCSAIMEFDKPDSVSTAKAKDVPDPGFAEVETGGAAGRALVSIAVKAVIG